MITLKEILKRLLTDRMNREEFDSLTREPFVEKKMKAQWDEIPSVNQNQILENLIWKKVEDRIGGTKNAWRKRFVWTASAASLLLVIGLASLWYFQKKYAEVEYTDVFAETDRMLVLPDQSKVWLKKGNSIRYCADFGKHQRKVWLKGEALFDVAKRKDCPFVVYFGETSVTVRGTKFFIDNSDEQFAEVLLYNGAVEFASSKTSGKILMHPDQLLKYEKGNGKVEVASVDASDYDWLHDVYRFSDKPIGDLLQFLEQTYHVTIHSGALSNQTKLFTGVIHKEESLEDVLDKLCINMDWNYKMTGNEISLY